MNFSTIKTWLAGLCVVALAGCGGGGGAAGDSALGGGSGSPASPTVTLSLSSPTVTAAAPATVTVTVRDAAGNPIAGTVVDLSTERGTLATLSVASVATDAKGTATATLTAAVGGLSGSDRVLGVAKLGTTTVQGAVSFTVAASGPTVALTIDSTTLRASTGATTLRAIVKDAAGNPVPNLLVSFAAAGKRVTLGSPSAKTGALGEASVTASVVDPTVTAADTLTASTTVSGLDVQSSVVVQLVADTPSITISASSSNVTAAAPATLSILVKDANAVAVGSGTVVKISSTFGLSTFDAATISTNSSGVAQVVVTPKAGNSNGADQIIASATVGGVAISAQVVVQVSTSTLSSPPVLSTSLSSTSISSATPATVTATLTDGKGQVVAGEVVTFTVVRGLAKTNIGTALTDATGKAVVILSPASSSIAGADEVTATATYAGTSLQSTKGFQIQATNVSITSFTSALPALTPLSAYGQTTLTVTIVGAAVGSPVNISVTSSCVSQGKATLSPSSFTATNSTVLLQYKDSGCGALQTEDKLQASIVGGSGNAALTMLIAPPNATSLAFISASPEIIYIKGSGFTESSTLTFELRDGAGNVLPTRVVQLSLLTRAGGVTMEGGTADVFQTTDAAGRVTVRVSSGTLPTPIRVSASHQPPVGSVIATVSSNLSVAVGLPSQLNFSLSQTTRNIEGFNIDGTANAYNIIASDRSGNPVPAGTSINFVTEGGQIEPIKQIQLASGLARASASFISSSPRPADGRITVVAYTLGEESFIDQNGNNSYDLGEPFQDLGNIFKDRIFDGLYDVSVDEYIPTNIANAGACLTPALSGPAFNGTIGVTATTSALLAFDPSIPSVGSVLSGASITCDGVWSGAGKVYVRRAAETVLSTSAARTLWTSKTGLDGTCTSLTLQTGPLPTTSAVFTPVQGSETWYGSGSTTLTLPFIVADANTFPVPGPGGTVGRLNPMAAGTVVSATATTGLKVLVAGASVPSTTEATTAGVGVTFDTASSGVVFVTFTSPSGVGTTYAINVQQTSAGKPSSCP